MTDRSAPRRIFFFISLLTDRRKGPTLYSDIAKGGIGKKNSMKESFKQTIAQATINSLSFAMPTMDSSYSDDRAESRQCGWHTAVGYKAADPKCYRLRSLTQPRER
jgi:hypothetical protein